MNYNQPYERYFHPKVPRCSAPEPVRFPGEGPTPRARQPAPFRRYFQPVVGAEDILPDLSAVDNANGTGYDDGNNYGDDGVPSSWDTAEGCVTAGGDYDERERPFTTRMGGVKRFRTVEPDTATMPTTAQRPSDTEVDGNEGSGGDQCGEQPQQQPQQRQSWSSSQRLRRSASVESPRTPLIEAPMPPPRTGCLQPSPAMPQHRPRFPDRALRFPPFPGGRAPLISNAAFRDMFPWPAMPGGGMRAPNRSFMMFPRKPPFLPTFPKRKGALQTSPVAKSPFMLLHEKFPTVSSTVKVECIDSADNSRPRFRCTADVSGEAFVGEGRSKKLAKQAMAMKAIEKLVPQAERGILLQAPVEDESESPAKRPAETTVAGASSGQLRKSSPSFEGKSILQILNELCIASGDEYKHEFAVKEATDAESEPASEGNVKPHEKQFCCTFTIGGSQFTAVAHSKKQAKMDAAKKALIERFKVDASLLEQDDRVEMLMLVSNKIPVQALKELCSMKHLPNTLKCERIQAPDKTVFQATCTVGDQSFEYSDIGAREAKYRVALKAMKEVFKLDFESSVYNPYGMVPYRLPKLVPDSTKSPCQMLNEMTMPKGKTVVYKEVPADEQKKSFGFAVTVDDKEFSAYASSKKGARQAAATKALKEMFNVEVPDSWQEQSAATIRAMLKNFCSILDAASIPPGGQQSAAADPLFTDDSMDNNNMLCTDFV